MFVESRPYRLTWIIHKNSQNFKISFFHEDAKNEFLPFGRIDMAASASLRRVRSATSTGFAVLIHVENGVRAASPSAPRICSHLDSRIIQGKRR